MAEDWKCRPVLPRPTCPTWWNVAAQLTRNHPWAGFACQPHIHRCFRDNYVMKVQTKGQGVVLMAEWPEKPGAKQCNKGDAGGPQSESGTLGPIFLPLVLSWGDPDLTLVCSHSSLPLALSLTTDCTRLDLDKAEVYGPLAFTFMSTWVFCFVLRVQSGVSSTVAF